MKTLVYLPGLTLLTTLGCAGGDSSAEPVNPVQEEPAALEEEVVFPGSRWRVNSLTELGDYLPSNSPHFEARLTPWRFLGVSFTIENTAKKARSITAFPELVDREGHRYTLLANQHRYTRKKQRPLSQQPLDPESPQTRYATYEVPPGAKQLLVHIKDIDPKTPYQGFVDPYQKTDPLSPSEREGVGKEASEPGGKAKKDASLTVSLGEKVTLKDSDWLVVEAQDLGPKLRPHHPFFDPLKSKGRFLKLQSVVTNRGHSPVRILHSPALVDGKGNEYHVVADQYAYLPHAQVPITMALMAPKATRTLWAIYQVPDDAPYLRLELYGIGPRQGQSRFVDLFPEPSAEGEEEGEAETEGESGDKKAGPASEG